jgi:hypothetical protein
MRYLRVWQVGLLVAVFVVWHLLTTPGLLPTSCSRTTARPRSSSASR